jgi:hypothetical protein
MCACGAPTLFGSPCDSCRVEERRRARVANKAGRDHRRHARKRALVMILRVNPPWCGVCFLPLTDVPYPDPMSTTVGHEPPLSVAAREGWLTVIERPEHKRCNLWKGTLTDRQLAGRVPV